MKWEALHNAHVGVSNKDEMKNFTHTVSLTTD